MKFLLRPAKVRYAIKVLGKLGFSLERIHGSHSPFYRDNQFRTDLHVTT